MLAADPFRMGGHLINYAVPAMGGFLTLVLAARGPDWPHPEGIRLVSAFAVYTLFSTLVGYAHRLAYLRARRKQIDAGKEPTNLPPQIVVVFLLSHFVLIVLRAWVVGSVAW